MIASPTKNADLICYFDVLEIQEITIRAYQRTEYPELMTHITERQDFLDWYKNKLETYDYTKNDEALKLIHTWQSKHHQAVI